MSQYALRGSNTHQLLTYGGRVLVHHQAHVLRYLFPNTDVVEVRVKEEDTFPLWAHPDVSHLNLERPKL